MIIIDYIESSQLCKISSDTLDKSWQQVRFQYGQITNQSEISESTIEIPWHTFISNIEILSIAISLFNVKVSFTPQTKRLFDVSMQKRKEASEIEKITPLTREEILETLKSNGFQRDLKKEQLRNIIKLSKLPIGATFSVPGSGKTTEAISFYLIHRKQNQGLLVICPKNAFASWEEQFKLCMGDQTPQIIRLTQGNDNIQSILEAVSNEVLLISYQQFIRVSSLIANKLHSKQFFVFIDESHRMKGGERTDTGRQIQKISHLPIGKLIMSGTPLPNSVADLIPQYSFLFPTDGAITNENVVEKISRIYVRTTKNEILDPQKYPIKTVRTEIPFTEPQKHLYDLIRS